MKKYYFKSFVYLFICLFFVLFSFRFVCAEYILTTDLSNDTTIPTLAHEDNDFGSSNESPTKVSNGDQPQAIVTPSTKVHLLIKTPTEIFYDQDIVVLPCDNDKNSETPDEITAYCAVLQSGIDNDWTWWGTGAFANSIGNITGYTSQDSSGNNVYHYWSIYFNNNYAEVGLNEYVLQPNDLITLDFVDPTVETDQSCSSCGSPDTKTFDINKAINFLKSYQKTDGSFGEDLYTDWVAIASGSTNNSSLKTSIKNYLLSNDFGSSLVTDNERNAMALMSLGINPYNGTEVNYIKKIVDSFNGEQIGDSDIVNDDIFGIIVLKNAGYRGNDEIISKTISFIISKQLINGSLGSTDMTGAFIQALKGFENIDGVNLALEKAKNYLISTQGNDGGFYDSFSSISNSSSTSWALQALSTDSTLGVNIEKADGYLADKQQEDGGVDTSDYVDNRIWATAYAIPAISHKPWSEVMSNFSKVVEPVSPVASSNDEEKKVEEIKITEEPKLDSPELKIEKEKKAEEIKIENLKEEKKIEEVNTDNLSANAIGAIGGKKFPRWVTQSIIGLLGIGILGFMFRFKI